MSGGRAARAVRTPADPGAGRTRVATARGDRPALKGLPEAIRPLLPAPLRAFHSKARPSMVQAWYGNRALHFEVWWRPRLGVIEVGLHFESDPLTNARLLGAMRERSAAIKRRLGAAARLEEWDRGWTRIWEPLPADAGLAERLAPRLARYIATLEPLLVTALPADVRWDDRS